MSLIICLLYPFPRDTWSHYTCCQGRTVGKVGVLLYPGLGRVGVS